ncbi:MAG TPA: ECF-type sigma factor [bacterium]|nr:ECF-type sigma factor [bacterium]
MAEDLTPILESLSAGDPQALDRVVFVLYDELRALARRRLRNERAGHTLQATALVNEVYLRLSRENRISAESRTRFMAVASNTMRRVLVDYARSKGRVKRGGDAERVPLESIEQVLSDEEAEEILALEDAMQRLARGNPRGARVVELRFFAGLSVEEIAEFLELSAKTVQRDWVVARAWLRKEVARDLGLPE